MSNIFTAKEAYDASHKMYDDSENISLDYVFKRIQEYANKNKTCYTLESDFHKLSKNQVSILLDAGYKVTLTIYRYKDDTESYSYDIDWSNIDDKSNRTLNVKCKNVSAYEYNTKTKELKEVHKVDKDDKVIKFPFIPFMELNCLFIGLGILIYALTKIFA